MTPTIEAMRAAWQSQDGTTELPVNDVKYNTWFYGHRVNGAAYAWCAVALSWIWIMACGGSLLPYGLGTKGSALVQQFRLNFQRLGKWGAAVRVGGFVCYAGDVHIEWCDEITPDGFFAWAGNTGQASFNNGGGVHRVFRAWAHLPHPIAGCCYPDYAPTPAPPADEEEDGPMLLILGATNHPALYFATDLTRKASVPDQASLADATKGTEGRDYAFVRLDPGQLQAIPTVG